MEKVVGFENLEVLRDGPYVSTWRGVRLHDQRSVILKRLENGYGSPAQVAALRHELVILKELDCPGILRPIGLEEDEFGVRLLLEDFDGVTLEKWALSNPDPGSFLRMAASLAQVLGLVHQHRVVHKNLKPDGILYNEERGEIRLMDFHIATRLMDFQRVTERDLPRDNLAFISPEQTGRMNRLLDFRSDFYSAGMIFYALLTGTPPFAGEDPLEMVYCHIAREPVQLRERNPRIPEGLAAIVHKLMAKAAEDRYQGAYGLLSDLERCREIWLENGEVPTFDLSGRDFSGRFLLPQKLYGRDREMALLAAAFARAGEQGAQLVLVSGAAGSGKTSLVRELEKEIVGRRAFFAAGRFEQYTQNKPYAALIQAVRDLIRQILIEPDGVIGTWRNRIIAGLGPSAGPLIDLIPELEMIIGPGETRDKNEDGAEPLRFLFPRLLRALAAQDQALVLFLDDLHQADEATKSLLQRLVSDPEGLSLLLVGAWRHDDDDNPVGMAPFLEQLNGDEGRIEQIALGELERDNLIELVADTLASSVGDAAPLADVILTKTHGNPFFVTEFFKQLHRDKLIWFDFQIGSWCWEADLIQGAGMTGNVVDLLIDRIRKLPPTTQYVLKYASCVGNSFDLKQLSIACEMNPSAVAECLLRARDEDLVHSLGLTPTYMDEGDEWEDAGDLRFQFLHERLQKAAFSMITGRLRGEAHLRLGTALLEDLGERDPGEGVFEITNHLNMANELIEDVAQRDRLAELNLAAGRLAHANRSYEAAADYLEFGFPLLGRMAWTRKADLSFELCMERGKCALARGRFSEARDLYEVLARHRSEQPVFLLGVLAHLALGDKEHALDLGTQGLLHLGVNVPSRVRRPLLWQQLATLAFQLRSRDASQPSGLLDSRTWQMVELLLAMAPAAYTVNPDLWKWVVLKASLLSLQQGNTASSALAYGFYAAVVGLEWDRWERGLPFARVALKKSKFMYAPHIRGRVLITYGSLCHLLEHLPRAADCFSEALRENEEVGLIHEAGTSLIGILTTAIFSGRPLPKIVALIRHHAHAARHSREASELAKLVSDWVAFLQNRASDNNSFRDNDNDLGTCLFCEESLAKLTMMRMQVDFLFGHYARVLESFSSLNGYSGAKTYLNPFFPDCVLYYGLSLAALWHMAESSTRRHYGRELKRHIRFLGRLAVMCPINYKPRHDLLLAENGRLSGRHASAVSSYDRALRGFAIGGFIHLEALAKELAAHYYRERGMESLAHVFLTDAHASYDVWGATAKVLALEEAFPESAPRKGQLKPPAPFAQLASDMDLGTLIKTSQAISGEIDLARLLEKIMRFLVENAGAQRGLLIMEKQGRLVIQAEGDLRLQQITVRQGTSVDEAENLCRAVVSYVVRTRESLVLVDACRNGRFAHDDYIRHGEKRSILCMPILHKSALTALIYLENDLITGAFTPERLAVLGVLSAQVAISLENARLVEELDEYGRSLAHKVEERTQELSHANQELVQKNEDLVHTQEQLLTQEKMAAMGAMASGIAHEIKNPLNFIDNFAVISEQHAGELSEYLERYSRVIDKDDLEEMRELLGTLEQNAGFINLHGARVNEIVDSIVPFSVKSSNRRQYHEINGVLMKFADIAYRGRLADQAGAEIEFLQELDPEAGNLPLVPEELGRALVNLLNNAFEAAVSYQVIQGGRPRVVLLSNNRENEVEIRVRDNGGGILEAIKDKVFNPFFSTKDNGIGIGLAIVHDIICKGHDGNIEFFPSREGGTEFVVRLPR